jgi:hypothetical protein
MKNINNPLTHFSKGEYPIYIILLPNNNKFISSSLKSSYGNTKICRFTG